MPFAPRHFVQLAAMLAIGVLLGVLFREARPPGRDVADRPAAVAVLRDTDAPTGILGQGRVTVVIFTDYRCPACRLAHPALMRAMADHGDVRVIWRDIPILGEASVDAARVAIAAQRQGRYARMHDALMTTPDVDSAIARAGVDAARLRADLARNARAIDVQIAANMAAAQSIGVTGTPVYLIGGTMIEGAVSQRAFASALVKAR